MTHRWALPALLVLAAGCNPGPDDSAPLPPAPEPLVLPGSPLPPSIQTFMPAVVLSNTAQVVTITGANLRGVTAGTVNAAPPGALRSFDAAGETSLTVTVPAGLPPGAWTVTLINGAGAATSTATLTVVDPPAVPPVVQTLTPATVTAGVAREIALTGNHFQGVTRVALGDDPDPARRTDLTSLQVLSPQGLRAVVPASAKPGSYLVYVTNAAGTSDGSLVALVVQSAAAQAPVVSAVTPTAGLTTVTTAVQLTGQRLTGAFQVRLNDPDETALLNLVVTSDTLLSAEIPPGVAPGTYGFFVSTPLGANTVSGAAITLTAPVFPAAPGPYQAGTAAVTVAAVRAPQNLDGTLYYPAETAGAGATPDSGGAPYPALVFAHERGLDRSYSTELFAHLASWGFAVLAADFGPAGATTDDDDAAKLRDMLDALTTLNQQPGGLFEGRLNTELIGGVGMGRGGAGLLLAARDDSRLDALALIAPEDPGVTLGRAVQILAAEKDLITPPAAVAQPLYDRQTAPKSLVVLQGGTHGQFLDADPGALLSGDGTATIDRAAQQTLLRQYVTAFFQVYLRGRSAEFARFVSGAAAQADAEAGLTTLQHDP